MIDVKSDIKEVNNDSLHSAIPCFYFWRFVFTYPDKTKGYTIRKVKTKDNAIADFNRIFPELKYYRIDFLNEV